MYYIIQIVDPKKYKKWPSIYCWFFSNIRYGKGNNYNSGLNQWKTAIIIQTHNQISFDLMLPDWNVIKILSMLVKQESTSNLFLGMCVCERERKKWISSNIPLNLDDFCILKFEKIYILIVLKNQLVMSQLLTYVFILLDFYFDQNDK